jgi:hypothetical protein
LGGEKASVGRRRFAQPGREDRACPFVSNRRRSPRPSLPPRAQRRRRSQGRAHLLPDRSVTGLRQASETGHRLGFEYAAKGTREVDAVADEITGSKWNCYVFRTPRIALQDAVSNAVAIGKPGLRIATLAQGYGLGRDGVAAFKEALTMTGRRSTLRNMRRSTPSISPLPRSAFLRR